MKILELSEKKYYLSSSIEYFKNFLQNRKNFIKKKKFLFLEISNFINNCIDNSKKIFVFCVGNSIITKNIRAKKIFVKEIHDEYKFQYNGNLQYTDDVNYLDLNECDTIVIADVEHQSNPASNLLNISKYMKDDAKIIILSKNIIWMIVLKILKFFFNFSPSKNNFLPSSYLNNLYSSCNLEIVRNEKIIALPIYIPFLTNFLNKFFRLPILNLFCLTNVTILKKITQSSEKSKKLRVSIVIPCKNEEKNIKIFEDEILNNNQSNEYLFGDDKSEDKTNQEIDNLIKKLPNHNIIKYEGPGVCKSENVYKGIDNASGDIIVIYDADLTVSFKDIQLSVNILKNTNADFINCTRMIYPQKENAMKFFNFIGNSFFAILFSLLFKKKITDTLCGTKIFYKKDWHKIKKDISNWGTKDLWGDFDLLIGAYKNNLKITEVPVTYFERKAGSTKMTSLISNGFRMLYIIFLSFYKLRLEK
ncbi:glycosyltransferase family 2 protein [Candidatus Pelagibacter communis]|uniref:glycosyltransferase family 2 protein n=1 Tax=Pelagibacter ubique TaxID=198252 RepID=UPI00094D7E9E|nr:glycosyltransferase family 2 protein [Candidatus Pelagibacter ubique]